jgi:hypothetical protein
MPKPTAMAVVDCGSGSTRLSIYSVHDDSFVHEDRYLPSNVLPTIVSALRAPSSQQEFIQTLKEVMKEEMHDLPITIGATGGLRKALDDGEVSRQQITDFQDAIQETFGGRAVFRELSGPDEARCELSAVQYIARHALPQSRPRYSRAGTKKIEDVGMLSCGGMSSQLAYSSRNALSHSQDLTSPGSLIKAAANAPTSNKKQDSKWVFTSFETNLLGAMAEQRQIGYNGGMGRLESRMWELMQASDLPRLTGTYVVVELVGTIGKEAGLADRLVPKREAVQLLSQHLNSMQLIAGKDLRVKLADDAASFAKLPGGAHSANPWERHRRPESVTWFQEARPALTLIALTLIESFSAGAWFYFATKFEVGSPQNVLRAQWPLGLFIQDSGVLGGGEAASPQSRL